MKHRFKILANVSEYRLEQQYDTVIACSCIHNINVLQNGSNDEIFEQAKELPRQSDDASAPVDDSYISPNALSDCEREECENWRDSIAEEMWRQYVATLEKRYGAQ